MKQVYAIKEVVGNRYLENAKYPDSKYCKYVFVNKGVGEDVLTFSSLDDAKAAYAQFLEHHAFVPFTFQEIMVNE